jgi:hypothetical protein
MTSPEEARRPSSERPPAVAAEDITARLAARAGERAASTFAGHTIDRLLAEDLPGNQMTTLLLHGLRRRAQRRTFVEVLEHNARAAMAQASVVDARRLHAFDAAAYAAARDFQAIELSPVLPLGATACAGVDPNNVLGAVRFAEVASDPAVGLALHAALRRRGGGVEALRLCASQRVLRMQPTNHPGFVPHFRLFALGTAALAASRGEDDARDRGALLDQLRVWADLARLLPAAGFGVVGLRVVLSDTVVVRACLAALKMDAGAMARRAKAHAPGSTEAILREARVELPRATADLAEAVRSLGLPAEVLARARALATEVAEPLRATHPHVEVVHDAARLQGLGYYAGPFVQLVFLRDDGAQIALGDGGALPWLGAMLSNRRERWIVTGMASEMLVKLYERASPP